MKVKKKGTLIIQIKTVAEDVKQNTKATETHTTKTPPVSGQLIKEQFIGNPLIEPLDWIGFFVFISIIL